MGVSKTTTKKAAKRTVKKSTKRVAATKRAAAKAAAPKQLVQAVGKECFWVCDGAILCNLHDLAEALRTMDEDTFFYHTKRDGNDFARWISDVLKDPDAATAVARARKVNTAHRAIVTSLKAYEA